MTSIRSMKCYLRLVKNCWEIEFTLLPSLRRREFFDAKKLMSLVKRPHRRAVMVCYDYHNIYTEIRYLRPLCGLNMHMDGLHPQTGWEQGIAGRAALSERHKGMAKG